MKYGFLPLLVLVSTSGIAAQPKCASVVSKYSQAQGLGSYEKPEAKVTNRDQDLANYRKDLEALSLDLAAIESYLRKVDELQKRYGMTAMDASILSDIRVDHLLQIGDTSNSIRFYFIGDEIVAVRSTYEVDGFLGLWTDVARISPSNCKITSVEVDGKYFKSTAPVIISKTCRDQSFTRPMEVVVCQKYKTDFAQ